MNERGFFRNIFNMQSFRGLAASVLTATALAASFAAPVNEAYAQQVPGQPQAEHTIEFHEPPENGLVGVEMIFALDTSGSMSHEEYAMQLRGLAHAINSHFVRDSIRLRGGERTFAFAVIDFGTTADTRINWFYIDGNQLNALPYEIGVDSDTMSERGRSSSAPDALDFFAERILNLSTRREQGSTNVDRALDLAEDMFNESPFTPLEGRVVNVFGDGAPSNTTQAARERDQLARMGVTINTIAIVNEDPDLELMYERHVQTSRLTNGPCFAGEIEGIQAEWCLESFEGESWALARHMRATGNSQNGLFTFYDEVVRAAKLAISYEPS